MRQDNQIETENKLFLRVRASDKGRPIHGPGFAFWILAGVVCLLGPWATLGAPPPAETPNTCLDCHKGLDPPLQVTAEQFARDIHARKGLTCADCHGGDPSSDDMERAMGRAAKFRGKPKHAQIPALCARCHSDGAYMRKYDPTLRTDQFSQYKTSIHGKRLARGDTKVAVCTDCHGVHSIRAVGDPSSPVYPLNVAKTCAGCHANADYMRGYGIPTNQFAGYSGSVHNEALTVLGDLSAPTCATCHGNHGAAPPGVDSVEHVCSTCHVFQAQMFDASPHKAVFAAMGLPSCVTCHSNHRIIRPTDAMLGTGNESVCLKCHSAGDPGYEAAQQMAASLTKLDRAITQSDEILNRAERSGMEVSQAKLEQAEARDALIKARVTIHSFQVARVDEDAQAGLKVAQKTLQQGLHALAELQYRRKGLALALLTIVAVLIGLGLLIRELESKPR